MPQISKDGCTEWEAHQVDATNAVNNVSPQELLKLITLEDPHENVQTQMSALLALLDPLCKDSLKYKWQEAIPILVSENFRDLLKGINPGETPEKNIVKAEEVMGELKEEDVEPHSKGSALLLTFTRSIVAAFHKWPKEGSKNEDEENEDA